VKMLKKIVRKITALLIVSLMLFFPVSLQACQEAEGFQETCCCCQNSDQHQKFDLAEQDECPCQLNEKRHTESQPATVVSHQESRPENLPSTLDVEFTSQNCFSQFRGTYNDRILLFSKGPPLYILHSSFLI